MKHLYTALFLALSVRARGQMKPQPEQTCPKYQHMEIIHPKYATCRNGLIPGDDIVCDGDHPECVDDLHIITEAEWQDLMQRLTALEYPWPKLEHREKP